MDIVNLERNFPALRDISIQCTDPEEAFKEMENAMKSMVKSVRKLQNRNMLEKLIKKEVGRDKL